MLDIEWNVPLVKGTIGRKHWEGDIGKETLRREHWEGKH